MPPPDRNITLQRIADELGLSITTVSRSLGSEARRYRISRKTEEKVRQLARSLGFTPNHVARSLRLKKTATIGLVIPDISNPFFAAIVRQITIGARAYRYSVIVCDSQDNEDAEIESIELLRARGVEGIVLCPVGRSAEHLAAFQNGDMPIVLADRYFPGVQLPYVVSDNAKGAREAVDYLIENGHRRVVCLQGMRGVSPNEDRLRGYREAFAERQIPVDETLIVGDSFSEENGYVTTKLLLKADRQFTAVFSFSNMISLGVLRALDEEGLRVPYDVSLVSFDDHPYLAYLSSPMTAVVQRTNEMGKIAVKMLFDRIRSKENTPIQGGILLPASLVIRQSVSNLSMSSPRMNAERLPGDRQMGQTG